MQYLLDKRVIKSKNGVNIHLIDTNRYRNYAIYFSFVLPDDLYKTAAFTILKEMLKDSCQAYPDKASFKRYKNLLYYASIDAYITPVYDKKVLEIQYDFIDPQYVEDITLKDLLNFIDETLFRPNLNENNFKENVKLVKQSFLRDLDKPRFYGFMRTLDILSEDNESFKSYNLEYVSYLDKLTFKDILDAYQVLLHNLELNIYLIGRLSDELIDYFINLDFMYYKGDFKPPVSNSYVDKGLIIEDKNISQSSLNVSYKLKYDSLIDGKRYYSFMVGLSLLGLLPSSLLFMEVREKLSLCYSINVMNYKKEGIFIIGISYSYKNNEELLRQIDIQLNRLIDGDYDSKQLESTKNLLISSYITNKDEADSIHKHYLSYDVMHMNIPFEEFLDNLRKVTKEDIAEVFEGSRHLLTHIVKENESNRE